ncbi:MAG: low molecular weight phosphotyrosine protein phosphatase [Gammaproteobacteria bacterium]|jgi:protein-tyrosine phosphatase|nr:low molecular weight phosphotyrosine protein phosphatase [Gammaproteobacteria bacterium]
MVRVLFVCMGNICRSPTAEGVFRRQLETRGLTGQVVVDSAGTHAYHVDEPPDPRSQAAARSRGIELGGQRARQVVVEDFASFDHILAMDADNLALLQARCPEGHRHKLGLYLAYAPGAGRTDVPDPYYGGGRGFEEVLDLVTAAGEGLLDHLAVKLR